MKNLFSTFEVCRDGTKPRLFRTEKAEVTIGFTKHCHLSLEPHVENGPELILAIPMNGRPVLRASRASDVFYLNGNPCLAEMMIRPGDIITTGAYRITVRDLPSSVEPPASEEPAAQNHTNTLVARRDETIDSEETAVAESKNPGSADAREKEGLSYLYLFFAPIQQFLADDDVAEVMINGPRQIYIERKGRLTAVPATFGSEQALQAAVINVARSIGRFFNKDNPRLDARLPDGSRVHAVMPPLSRMGTIVAIRKFRRERLTMQQLVEFGSISSEGARLLEVIVTLGKNLIVSGATSSGKTSVLNVLSSFIPNHERILVLEDASELQLQQTHAVCFETRKADEYGKGEITIRDLLHSALRLRPDRLVVGEIRGGEALDLLQAMNTGHDGSMSTIHANTARDCLSRMETCALFSGIEIPLAALREQVAAAIHVVIQTARLHDGSRKITSITEVLSLKDGQHQLEDILIFQEEGLTSDDRIRGRHVFTGYQPKFANAARLRGFDLTGLFLT